MRNFQANSIIEHIHQTIRNMMSSFELKKLKEKDPWDSVLPAMMIQHSDRKNYEVLFLPNNQLLV